MNELGTCYVRRGGWSGTARGRTSGAFTETVGAGTTAIRGATTICLATTNTLPVQKMQPVALAQ